MSWPTCSPPHLDAYTPERFSDEVREMKTDPEGGYQLLIGGEWIKGRTVVLCSGSRYRRLGVPGEDAYLGKGVSFCALCDGNFFRDQTVAVIGGGNSALEESLYLSRLVKKIYLIHRRDEFRGCKCYLDKCMVNPKIEPVLSTVVHEIQGGTAGVSSLLLEDLKTHARRELPVDGVFVFIGFEPVGDFLPKELEARPGRLPGHGLRDAHQSARGVRGRRHPVQELPPGHHRRWRRGHRRHRGLRLSGKAAWLNDCFSGRSWP